MRRVAGGPQSRAARRGDQDAVSVSQPHVLCPRPCQGPRPGRVGVWVPGPPPLRRCPGPQHIPVGDWGARNPLRSLPHLPAASQALGDGTAVAMATCSCRVTSQPAARPAQGEKPSGPAWSCSKGSREAAPQRWGGSRPGHPPLGAGGPTPPGWPHGGVAPRTFPGASTSLSRKRDGDLSLGPGAVRL